MSGQTQEIHRYPVVKLQDGNLVAAEEMLAAETPLTIRLNGRELVTLLCSPVDRNYLALGFLAAAGLIADTMDLALFSVDNERGLVMAETKNTGAAGCAGVTEPAGSALRLSGAQINSYARLLEEASLTHKLTGGVHSGAIFAGGELRHYAEDISRHNVFDKLRGKCLEAKEAMAATAMVFSGRVSSEILLKAGKMGIPVLIARSVPSSLAVELAQTLGITLIGAAKGDRFTVYSHAGRVGP